MDGKKGSKVLEHPLWHSRPSLMLFKNFWFFWELELFRNIFYDFFFLDEVSIHKKISKNFSLSEKKSFMDIGRSSPDHYLNFIKYFPQFLKRSIFFTKFYLEKFWFYSIKQIQVFFDWKTFFPHVDFIRNISHFWDNLLFKSWNEINSFPYPSTIIIKF